MIRAALTAVLLQISSSLALADTAPNHYPRQTSSAETAGVLSGMALGGSLGGPPGIIAGAVIGALLGDGYNARRQVSDLQLNLYESQLRLAMQEDESERLRLELSRNTPTGPAVPVRIVPARANYAEPGICCDNTVVSVHFRSGSSHIEDHELEILDSLAALSLQLSDPLIEITGYADRNGDAEANLQLSRHRNESVRQYLLGKGLTNTRVITVAYGESHPLQANQSLETDFFDRRVLIRLRDGSQLMLSRNAEQQ